MTITRQQLTGAVAKNILSAEQAEQLYEFLQHTGAQQPRFDFTHVLYYLGGLVAIGAMTLFMSLAWESFGGWGIFFIALAYAGVGLKLTAIFERRGYAVPAGICATFAVALTPLAVYGLQQGLGIWPDASHYRDYHHYIKGQWLYMELTTLAVGAVVAWRYQYPFLQMPIAATLWYMSMDISAFLADGHNTFELRALVSLYFGALMVALAFWVDIRSRHSRDYAFWLYLFGVVAFWGGLTCQHSNDELAKFFYACINLAMVGIGVLLVRCVFVVFGALGIAIYLGHLAFNLFADSWFFPVALSALGLAIIYLGVLWQKHERPMTRKMRACLPVALRELLVARGV